MACDVATSDDMLLFDFESEADLDRIHWQCFVLYSLSDEHATHGENSLKIEFYPSAFPGFNPKLDRSDWRGYHAVEFDIFNPASETVAISLKIDDRPGPPAPAERFNRELQLVPGPNHIRIKLDEVKTGSGRHLDQSRIAKVFLVHENLSQPMVLYLDRFRLTSKGDLVPG